METQPGGGSEGSESATGSFLALAETMVNIPGAIALLIGSGLSSAAHILTGWQIMLDLIRQTAEMAHVTPLPADDELETWYRTTYQTEPTYGVLLGQVAATSTERGQILQQYFTPTNGDRAHDASAKLPTAAHHAIARLVASGVIKVILTTNFDRLLEQALQAAGIEPTVIATPDMVEGMLPLRYLRDGQCTLIKLHGDYLDGRLKNTTEELATYDPRVNQLLDQVFDEYGLLVCGWSGEWDQALRDALSRRQTRRFAFYWAPRSMLGVLAATLVQQQDALILPRGDADSCFQTLVEQVMALRALRARVQPLSARVAGETIKRYLVEERERIRMDDLLATETEHVFAACAVSDANGANRVAGELGAAIERRLAQYETHCAVLLAMYTVGGAFAAPAQAGAWVRSLTRICNPEPTAQRPWPTTLALYPALFLLYGAGLAAVTRDNYGMLAALLYQVQRLPEDSDEPKRPLAVSLDTLEVLDLNEAKKMPQQLGHHTPLSDHLHASLREPLRAILPDDRDYDAAFDRLEYLLALAHTTLAKRHRASPAAPGRYIWHSKPPLWDAVVVTELNTDREQWKPLAGGLFPGIPLERLRDMATQLQQWNAEVVQRLRPHIS